MFHRCFSAINRFNGLLTYQFVTFIIHHRHIFETQIINQKSKIPRKRKKSKAMKTSILVSTFAALCLLITYAESPSRLSTDSRSISSVSNFSYIPASNVTIEPAIKLSANTNKAVEFKSAGTLTEDLGYLKFDVSDYSNDKDIAVEVNNENSLEYLKFDVNDYTSSDETASYESIELPVNDFDYLKFDVNDYTSSDETASYESIELPVNEFEYLRFDVSKYSNENHVIIGELPVAE